MTTVGTGKYTYEIVEGWGSLPQGWELGQTAIVTDSQDRVYLFNRSDHPLIVLDRDGNFLSAWGEGVLSDAHGMFIDAEDNLYLPVKNNHVVLKYSSQGNLLMSLGTRDQPSDTGWSGNISDPVQRAAAPFNRPTDVALSPDGDLYISDGYGNSRVHKFTAGASCSFRGESRGKPVPECFTSPMAYGCTPTAGSLWPTGKTTGSRFLTLMAISWTSGPISPVPAISTLTRTRSFLFPSWTRS